jgi:hypothetical protein
MNLEQAGRSGATVHIMSLSIVIFVPEFTTLKDIRARLAGSYSLGEDEGLGEVEELNVGHHDGRPICVIEYPIETLNGILQRRGIDASQLRGFWLHFCRLPAVNDVIKRIVTPNSWVVTTTEKFITGQEFIATVESDPAWNPYGW